MVSAAITGTVFERFERFESFPVLTPSTAPPLEFYRNDEPNCNTVGLRLFVRQKDVDEHKPAFVAGVWPQRDGFGRGIAKIGTMPVYDTLWFNARLATMTPGGAAYGAIEHGALAARDGAIAWVGASDELPDVPARLATRVIDAGRRWMTPGLVDPHTHLVFGGERVGDFERRVAGQSYVAAASGGSGIAHTVAMTRAADEETLYRDAARRLRTMIANGTTTVEIKSGYGLDVETELRLLRVARRLGARSRDHGAHDLPRGARRAAGVRRSPRRVSRRWSASRCCRASRAKDSPTRWTSSAIRSRSHRRRPRACSMRRGGSDSRSRCMPTR